MSDPTPFKLKFWGTRGSIPCPGPDTVKYGGNTTCFEITCGSKRIIIDAGTGIRLLGKKIMIEEETYLMPIYFSRIPIWITFRVCLFSAPLQSNQRCPTTCRALDDERRLRSSWNHWNHANEGSCLSGPEFPD